MNKTIWIVGVIVLLVIAGVYFSKSPKEDAMMDKQETSMMEEKGKVVMDKQETSMMEDKGEVMVEKDGMMKAGSYEAYSPEKISLASSAHDVVLFFRAVWCPTCRAVDADIRANSTKIPENLTILDVNYDNSSDLKKKYGVTYQHTFVQVDKDGNLIKKWSGSPTLSSIIAEVK